MTFHIKIDLDTGQIIEGGNSGLPPVYSLENYKFLDQPIDILKYYWEDGLKEIPESPGSMYTFNYQTKQWELDEVLAWAYVKAERSHLFSRTEWVRSRALDQGVPVPQEWKDYWQALRDIPLQSDPLNIVWPTPPSS